MAPPNIWPDLIKSAQFRWAGDVDLDEGLLAQVFAGLLRHKPWAGSADDRCDTTVAAR
jgi:hypothetical protein